MPFGSASPPYVNKEGTYTELDSISDEEFRRLVRPYHFTKIQRAFQIFCFCLFLGPIRMVVGFVVFAGCVGLINLIQILSIKFDFKRNLMRTVCRHIARIGFIFFNASMGVLYYKINGKIDPEARFIISNHVSLIDPFVYIVFFFYTPIVKYEVSKVKAFHHIMNCVDVVYVKRDAHHGQSQHVLERADNPACSPVLIFPEGTIPGGPYTLKFHRTAFLTEHKVQPLTIRYCMPLVPEGWNEYVWRKTDPLPHLWLMVSNPFTYVSINVLPVMTKAVDGEGDVEKFATKAQLLITNSLGLRPTNRSSHELFHINKQSQSADSPGNVELKTAVMPSKKKAE